MSQNQLLYPLLSGYHLIVLLSPKGPPYLALDIFVVFVSWCWDSDTKLRVLQSIALWVVLILPKCDSSCGLVASWVSNLDCVPLLVFC